MARHKVGSRKLPRSKVPRVRNGRKPDGFYSVRSSPRSKPASDKIPLSVAVEEVPNLDVDHKILAFLMREHQLVSTVNVLAIALASYAGLRRKLAMLRSELDEVREVIDHVCKDMSDIKPYFASWSPGQIILDLFEDASILEIALWETRKLKQKPAAVPDTLAMAFAGKGDYA